MIDCPFDLDLPENEEEQDPQVDEDSKRIIFEREKINYYVDDFEVTRLEVPESVFDKK